LEDNDKPVNGEMVITFEADITGVATSSIFCGWFIGYLTFELDPLRVFYNLLLRNRHSIAPGCKKDKVFRPTGDLEDDGENSSSSTNDAIKGPTFQRRGTQQQVCRLNGIELMSFGEHYLEKGPIIFRTYKDPAWAIVCAGCTELGTVIVERGHLDLDPESCLATPLSPTDTIIHFDL
jgi:hypothetical protein